MNCVASGVALEIECAYSRSPRRRSGSSRRFKSVMTYVPEVEPESLVSLTMPVRTEYYPWEDPLHPILAGSLSAALGRASF